jgi:hypothetical protein
MRQACQLNMLNRFSGDLKMMQSHLNAFQKIEAVKKRLRSKKTQALVAFIAPPLNTQKKPYLLCIKA